MGICREGLFSQMSSPNLAFRKKRLIPALRWEDGVEGVWAAGRNGSEATRNSHQPSVSIWMLCFMLMPTCSLSGLNITDFAGVFPQWGLVRRKWDLFHHKTSATLSSLTVLPDLQAYFYVNRGRVCAQESIAWGLYVSRLKAMSRLSSFGTACRVGSLQQWAELAPNTREISYWC